MYLYKNLYKAPSITRGPTNMMFNRAAMLPHINIPKDVLTTGKKILRLNVAIIHDIQKTYYQPLSVETFGLPDVEGVKERAYGIALVNGLFHGLAAGVPEIISAALEVIFVHLTVSASSEKLDIFSPSESASESRGYNSTRKWAKKDNWRITASNC